MTFFLSYLVLAQIFAIASISANLLVGVAGIFAVSQAAIFGIGAYLVANLISAEIIPFFPALILAVVLGASINVLAALPALRISGDYFVVTSFGLQIVATTVFVNMSDWTGGAAGMVFTMPDYFGIEWWEPANFLMLSTPLLLLACLVFWLLMRSPFGKTISAIREDEIAVVAAGKNVVHAKLGTAGVAGALAGMGGGLYAVFLGFIDPSSFDIVVSILLITMVAVGGARTLAGALVGAFLLMSLPQILTLAPVSASVAGPLRQLVYGALLVIFMLYRPQGIAGRKLGA